MKLTVVVDPKNKYMNRLYCGSRMIASGTDGLENVEILTKGKRAMVVLSLTKVEIVMDSEICPESYRYDEISKARGNAEALGKLGITCDMLKTSPNACDGCMKNPNRSRQTHPVPAGRDVDDQQENRNGRTTRIEVPGSKESLMAVRR